LIIHGKNIEQGTRNFEWWEQKQEEWPTCYSRKNIEQGSRNFEWWREEKKI